MERAGVGAILIGGRSSRMGSDKATIRVAGETMLERVGRVLAAAQLEVITAGSPARATGYPNVADPSGTAGPLGGLFGALGYAGGRPVFLAAVDQPLLQSATVEALLRIRTHDAVVPHDRGFPQVTCALYRTTCLPAIRQLVSVNPNASIRDVLDLVAVRWIEEPEWSEWGETGDSWRSVDTPEDLAAIRALLEES